MLGLELNHASKRGRGAQRVFKFESYKEALRPAFKCHIVLNSYAFASYYLRSIYSMVWSDLNTINCLTGVQNFLQNNNYVRGIELTQTWEWTRLWMDIIWIF